MNSLALTTLLPPQTYYVFALPLSIPVLLSIMFGHWLAIKYFQNN